MRPPALAIFDIGKTNKKIIVFDEQYNLLHEESCELPEALDEDGDACEDVHALSAWVKATLAVWLKQEKIELKGVNVSAYGASFVHLDEQCQLASPLYNYLKPYPKTLEENFYQAYGGVTKITRETASPALGSLNSGLQLYRLKRESPEIYSRIKYSLHLPQYISYLLTGKLFSEITSLGCHTLLWDFEKKNYHEWVGKEGIEKKFPRLMKSNAGITVDYDEKKIVAGSGLHDSSAALIPYLASFSEPFVLISTGTWCISLNPFNDSPLTDEELKQDCLCYLSYQGTPVKASRIFAGNDHEV
ncbi:MAG TPA: FGGY family carbohydrate kinase, partial [Cyclobacteriaceae bacterium]|nr:FGGY family carbohydrate kinase [Cyclobacteriaceae bacterium]